MAVVGLWTTRRPGMPDTTILVVVGFWIVCGLAAGWISQNRQLGDPADWFVTGVLLGPFGVIWALVKRPPAPAPASPTTLAAPTPSWPTSTPSDHAATDVGRSYQCPHCSRPISGNEAFCPHCGGRLTMGAGTARNPEPATGYAPAVPAKASGSRTSTIVVILLVLAVLGVSYVLAGMFNRSGPATPNVPAAVNIPPAGQIWFGTSFNPTTLEVTSRLTTVGTQQGFVMVGRMGRVVDASELQIRTYLDGQLVASNTTNATGSSDTWGFNLGPLFQAGSWRYELADIGGNVLASGSITAT